MITVYYCHLGACPKGQAHKREHELGLALLAEGLCGLYGLSIPAEELPSQLSYHKHKKPFLAGHEDIFFNISHSRGIVACGFSTCELGVDVEAIHGFNERVARKVFTEGEREFLEGFRQDERAREEAFCRLWTLKESCAKQTGLGLAMPFADFSFTLDLSGKEPSIRCSRPGLFFRQQLLGQSHVLSVCSGEPIEGLTLRNKEIG